MGSIYRGYYRKNVSVQPVYVTLSEAKGLKKALEILRGACPERYKILRYAQNDRKRRAQNGSGVNG